jgi:putative PEP-CTERM system histidine kinase
MSLTLFGYTLAAVAYGALSLVLLWARESNREGNALLVVVLGTALWGCAIVALLAVAGVPAFRYTALADALRAGTWTLCLLSLIPGRGSAGTAKGVIVGVGAVLLVATLVEPFLLSAVRFDSYTLLAWALLGCFTVWQVLRKASAEHRQVLRVFLWTLVVVGIWDVLVFAHGVVTGSVDMYLWASRAFVATVAVPFLLFAAKRHPNWTETLFVSREFVFYVATLTGISAYLMAIAIGGIAIRERGGEWGAAIQAAYVIAAVLLLVMLVSSQRLRARVRVFISKHFYRNRYDYRDEWLRLIRTLSDSDEKGSIDQRSIQALCAIVGSAGGDLWLDRDGRAVYEPFASWQSPFPKQEFIATSPLVRFIREHQWVIDSRQYEDEPQLYENAFADENAKLPPNSLIVPLMHQQELLGLMRLDRPAGLRWLNFEDHDLLRTAGRQVAAFLAHDMARERLAETQQFDAYNKLSAFVMHDLKNLLAQQALLVENAKKFRNRPEFVEDAITTIDSGVQRMRRLLWHLQRDSSLDQKRRVELNGLLLRVVSGCSEGSKPPCSFTGGPTCWVRARPDQLSSVFTHVINNAQEATIGGGVVSVSLAARADGRVAVEVSDRGKGMTEEFVRRKLFKPFETTKGRSGMGIGAYQAREVVRGLGGEMVVSSEPGRGTTVVIYLPGEGLMSDDAPAPAAFADPQGADSAP